ncbi:AIR12, DOMON domain [Dillenia turbinata]|uniref:AIR12, DOMON domain n=1 Tax=Dillenia turbinata TaxID=194707 RepID=A0AAN8UNA6_9MAGN
MGTTSRPVLTLSILPTFAGTTYHPPKQFRLLIGPLKLLQDGLQINPTGTGMLGSQALVAFLHSNGSMIAYPTPITSYSPSMKPGTLSFQVSNISAEYSNNEMAIFATIGPLSNGTTVNHVWQAGNSVSNDIPQMHPTTGPNVQSMGSLNFLAG